MEWWHAPIPDGWPPGPDFEDTWASAGEAIRDRLRLGFDVLVHCRGGLGRAGTVAARLLVELGASPDGAIRRVRDARSRHAIETASQEAHVARCAARAPSVPSQTAAGIRDRALGAFLGLAIGDAVGTTLEFRSRDAQPRLEDMTGGGPFALPPGAWTDDTAMALALADSLAATDTLDCRDLMNRFTRWWRNGEYSCTGTCFDIGNATRAALDRYARTGDPLAGSTHPRTAGNGSLMRLAPVALRFWNTRGVGRVACAAGCEAPLTKGTAARWPERSRSGPERTSSRCRTSTPDNNGSRPVPHVDAGAPAMPRSQPAQDETKECNLWVFVICDDSGRRIPSIQFALAIPGLKRNHSDVERG